MVLLISYDLNGHERPSAYAAVKEMIEQNSTSSVKPLYSQWFVETDESPAVWHKRMKDVADDNDRWFIDKVTGDYIGMLSTEAVNWLKERV